MWSNKKRMKNIRYLTSWAWWGTRGSAIVMVKRKEGFMMNSFDNVTRGKQNFDLWHDAVFERRNGWEIDTHFDDKDLHFLAYLEISAQKQHYVFFSSAACTLQCYVCASIFGSYFVLFLVGNGLFYIDLLPEADETDFLYPACSSSMTAAMIRGVRRALSIVVLLESIQIDIIMN